MLNFFYFFYRIEWLFLLREARAKCTLRGWLWPREKRGKSFWKCFPSRKTLHSRPSFREPGKNQIYCLELMKNMDYKLLSSMDSKKTPVNYILNTDYMFVGVCLNVNFNDSSASWLSLHFCIHIFYLNCWFFWLLTTTKLVRSLLSIFNYIFSTINE